jgi:Tfp pilus assembly protein PilV
MMNLTNICVRLFRSARAFTLLETMIAVTLLAVSIVAPMTLTAQSLKSAYYARDQVTAFYLAQEGLEAVRNVRDNNILQNSQGTTPVDLLQGIPSKSGSPFRIDARNNTMTLCSTDGSACLPLQTDGTLYGYNAGWTTTQFLRTLTACFVQPSGACNGTVSDEAKITVTVSWRTGGLQLRTVNISENLYRWVEDGIAAP